MNQTSYLGVNNFIKGLPLTGGFCKFWFIPIEEVVSLPPINPLTQALLTEIPLKAGGVWRGPVPVPDKQLGFTEDMKAGPAGISYDQKVSAVYPGEIPGARTNFENMAYHKYMVVGKLRATPFFVLIGRPDAGADFNPGGFDSGSAAGGPVLNKISFTNTQINKALVLSLFSGTESGYVDFTGATIAPANDFWELE